MDRPAQWDVIYATPCNSTTIPRQSFSEPPPPAFAGGITLLPLVDPDEAGIKPTPWLVEGWLRAEGVTILSGRYKSLKAFIARQLALSIGPPILGYA